MNQFQSEAIQRGFARLLARAPAPTSIALRPGPENRERAAAGDLWWVRVNEIEDEEPLMVMLLEPTCALFCEEPVWRTAPVFSEVEMASDEDVILPREVAGGKVAVALGCEAPVAQRHFLQCAGSLPETWLEKVLNARTAFVSGVKTLPEGFLRGVPVVHQDDPALAFHEELVRRLEPLMAPFLAEALAGQEADESAPVSATTPWLAAEWERWRAAAKQLGSNLLGPVQDYQDWVRAFAVSLEVRQPAQARFLADDGMRTGQEDAVVELSVPDVDALLLLVRETPASAEWQVQVLEDPRNALDGAELIDVADGRALTAIQGGLGTRAFALSAGQVLLRLSTGDLARLERVEG